MMELTLANRKNNLWWERVLLDISVRSWTYILIYLYQANAMEALGLVSTVTAVIRSSTITANWLKSSDPIYLILLEQFFFYVI